MFSNHLILVRVAGDAEPILRVMAVRMGCQDMMHTLIHSINLPTRWKKPENLKETNRDMGRTCTEMVTRAQGQMLC